MITIETNKADHDIHFLDNNVSAVLLYWSVDIS